jgi:hypothetical protein
VLVCGIAPNLRKERERWATLIVGVQRKVGPAPGRVSQPPDFTQKVLSPRNDCESAVLVHCLILGFATEYSTSVKKFTATYVNPIARMQPCTR